MVTGQEYETEYQLHQVRYYDGGDHCDGSTKRREKESADILFKIAGWQHQKLFALSSGLHHHEYLCGHHIHGYAGNH